MIQKTKIESINAKIIANTCGTGTKKTLWVKVNCEMGMDEAGMLIHQIDAAREWLKHAEKENCGDCQRCDAMEVHADD